MPSWSKSPADHQTVAEAILDPSSTKFSASLLLTCPLHSIRFWGNIAPSGMAELRFDVHVVPDANYHHDYEEMYDKEESTRKLREYFRKSGETSGMGYYVDR